MADELTFDETKHEYKLNGLIIPSVTKIIGEIFPISDFISKELLEQKADLGKKVHKTIELNDSGNLDVGTLHPLLRKYLDNWIKFKCDYNFTPMDIELQLSHPLYKYAGRVDQVGLIDKDLTVLDIKSGAVQKTHSIQTAAYQSLYEINKCKVKRRMAVYLSPDNYKIEEHKNKNDISVFHASLTIYNYKKTNNLK
jgi:hypothetical protein